MSQTKSNIKAKILYIDDDPINRSLVNRILTNCDFQVVEAESGLDGIRIATNDAPDLILMDIHMPGLDGHETTTRMRTITGLEKTPIVAVTANTTREARELALTAGCNGYIHKPINVQEFPHQITTYLEGRQDTVSKDIQHQRLGRYSQKLVERLETKILELEEANVRLQKANKLKSDFITVAAHELRTPMTLVYGYSRLLQSAMNDVSLPESNEGYVVDLVDKINSSVYRLNDVVNDILNVFYIQANMIQLDFQSVDLASLIQSALDELSPKKNNRNLKLTLEQLDILPNIVGDPERLRQVFWNLLSNAIKFTPNNGSILVRGKLAEKAEQIENNLNTPGDHVIIMIEDTGIGIAKSDQKDIFDRFYMAEDVSNHTSSKTAFGGGGIGLGLPIAKGIIEAHGGRIWVESEGSNAKGTPGSTFYVLLPTKSADC